MNPRIQFILPPGYRAWCHTCGRPPLNKTTTVTTGGGKLKELVGVGFQTITEGLQHQRKAHGAYRP